MSAKQVRTLALSGELQPMDWIRRGKDAKWQMAFDTLGFDISMLSPVSGNA